MAFDTAYPQILANLAAGNQPVATIDSNLTPLYNGLLLLNTFSNYYADSGAANAYVVTVTARQAATLAAGLSVQLLSAHVNTGASTLNVNGTGAKNILRINGTALGAGDIPLNGIISVMYDGTQYLLLSPYAQPRVTNQLAGDVALNNTGLYFTGPTCAQGTVGTWLAMGTVTCSDTAGSARFDAKLTDGTTVFSTTQGTSPGGNDFASLSLQWVIASPAGNIRIEVKDGSATTGRIDANDGVNGNINSSLTVIRIA